MLEKPIHFIFKKRALLASKMWDGGWASVQNRKFSSIAVFIQSLKPISSASLTCASRWRGQSLGGPHEIGYMLIAHYKTVQMHTREPWLMVSSSEQGDSSGILKLAKNSIWIKVCLPGFRHVCFNLKIPVASRRPPPPPQHHHLTDWEWGWRHSAYKHLTPGPERVNARNLHKLYPPLGPLHHH